MPKPHVPARKPIVLDLEPGTYWYCTCGRSADQPFCDGAHKGSEFRPTEFTVTEARKSALCRCKYTREAPYCDGSHRQVLEGDEG